MSENNDGLSDLIEKGNKSVSSNGEGETVTKISKSVSVENTIKNGESENHDNLTNIDGFDYEEENSAVRVTGSENKMEIVKDNSLNNANKETKTKVTKVTTVETTTEIAQNKDPSKGKAFDNQNTIKIKSTKKKSTKKKAGTKGEKITKKKTAKVSGKKNSAKKKATRKKISKKKSVKKKVTKKKTTGKRNKSSITSKEGKSLEKSMLLLAKQINTLADIFSIATKELKKDVEGEMIDKLNKILHENSIIAEAILTLLEEIKEDNKINRTAIKKHGEHQENLQPFSTELVSDSLSPNDHKDELYKKMKNIASNRIESTQNNTTNNINIQQNNELRDVRQEKAELTHKNIRDIFSGNTHYSKKKAPIELKGIPKINELPPGIDEKEEE